MKTSNFKNVSPEAYAEARSKLKINIPKPNMSPIIFRDNFEYNKKDIKSYKLGGRKGVYSDEA